MIANPPTLRRRGRSHGHGHDYDHGDHGHDHSHDHGPPTEEAATRPVRGSSMHLSPKETDRLLLFLAAELAGGGGRTGCASTIPEARALIADEICEGARDGRSVAELMDFGGQILTTDDVLPGVAEPDRRAAGRGRCSRTARSS